MKLGEKTVYSYKGADKALLERFDNPFSEDLQLREVFITAPEFTSLCPITGQPDFATIKVKYVPEGWCVESKSFKLYLGSFRQEGMFHESCVNKICEDLVNLLNPHELLVIGEFSPRGGISFWPSALWKR